MTWIVQKFGGTSLADQAGFDRCADRIDEARRQGGRVIAVVSARGHATDHLVQQAEAISSSPDADEMAPLLATGEQASAALFALHLRQRGLPARSLRPWEIGLLCTDEPDAARIRSVCLARIIEIQEAGEIPVIPGFQGVTEQGALVTLGRGGSDATAVALAAALHRSGRLVRCEIHTDVDGVMSADPRYLRETSPVRHIGTQEMLALSEAGAIVLHAPAVRIAHHAGVAIHVRHSDGIGHGSLIDPHARPRGSGLAGAIACAYRADLEAVTLTFDEAGELASLSMALEHATDLDLSQLAIAWAPAFSSASKAAQDGPAVRLTAQTAILDRILPLAERKGASIVDGGRMPCSQIAVIAKEPPGQSLAAHLPLLLHAIAGRPRTSDSDGNETPIEILDVSHAPGVIRLTCRRHLGFSLLARCHNAFGLDRAADAPPPHITVYADPDRPAHEWEAKPMASDADPFDVRSIAYGEERA